MSNCAFQDSFRVYSQINARLRQVNQSEFSAKALDAAFRQAQVELDKMYPSDAPVQPTVRWRQPQEPAPPRRPRCTEHRERTFVFSDGSECSACTATGCSWGIRVDGTQRGPKHSSDGVPFASELDVAQGILDLMDDEPETSEVDELFPLNQPITEAGRDDPETEHEDQPEDGEGETIADESGVIEVAVE